MAGEERFVKIIRLPINQGRSFWKLTRFNSSSVRLKVLNSPSAEDTLGATTASTVENIQGYSYYLQPLSQIHYGTQ